MIIKSMSKFKDNTSFKNNEEMNLGQYLVETLFISALKDHLASCFSQGISDMQNFHKNDFSLYGWHNSDINKSILSSLLS